MDLEGFAILRSRGVTRRANSVVGLDLPKDRAALGAAVDRVESLIAAGGEAPIFRIFDDPQMRELDALLEERGYRAEGVSEVLERDLPGGGALTARADARIRTGMLDEEWFAQYWRLAPREGDAARDTVRDIMAGTPAVQVALPAPAPADSQPTEADAPHPGVAVGRAALVEFGRSLLTVIDAVAVAPGHRRQGLGRAVVQTLLVTASLQGAQRALLEVEATNEQARRLYTDLGFRRVSAYHYRASPAAAGT